MRLGRAFMLCAFAALAAIGVWQMSGDEGRAMVLAYSRHSPQQQQRQQQDEMAALCRAHSSVTPLAVKLEGRVVSVQGSTRSGQIAAYVRQALPGARVFVDGSLEERIGFDAPTYLRTGAPGDAIVIRASEQQLPRKEGGRRAPPTVHEVTVLDPSGGTLGRWQGFLTGCPSSGPRDPLPFTSFLASRRAGAPAMPDRRPAREEIPFEVLTEKARHVARPEDFTLPVSSPQCQASLVRQGNARDPSLQVATPGGAVLFRFVRSEQTMPAVACSEERSAVLFRTPTHVAIVSLDAEGYILASARVPLKKGVEREAFRDVAIQGDKLRATLVAFELDRKGSLVATEGRRIVATLGTAPQRARAERDAAALGLTKHEACVAPPALGPEVEVHEMSGVGPAWEYVQLPGQQPTPFRNVIVDAPLRTVALSFQRGRAEMVWLVQATAGTNLRYVEIAADRPQTVILKNPGGASVNVATAPSCPLLFGSNSPTRSAYSIRPAYAQPGAREVIGLVLLANGNPFVSAAATHQALEAFGYRHLSSLTSYLLELKADGAIDDATPADIQRFRDHYYEGMPLGRKVASWFRQDPALDIQSRWGGLGYVVKRPFPLPKHPAESTLRDTLLLVDKGVALPTGNLAEYMIIDANTLSCPGQQRSCPWSRP
jgi:hypothetical protein